MAQTGWIETIPQLWLTVVNYRAQFGLIDPPTSNFTASD